MEKIKEFKETMTRRVHMFYCDDCGEEIMTCKEWNDRTFVRPDMSDFNICHMKLKGEYCDKCAEIRRHKALVELIVNVAECSPTVVGEYFIVTMPLAIALAIVEGVIEN